MPYNTIKKLLKKVTSMLLLIWDIYIKMESKQIPFVKKALLYLTAML